TEDHDDEDVGNEGHKDTAASEVRGVDLLSLDRLDLDGRIDWDADALGGLAAALGFPDFKEKQGEGDGDDGGENLSEVVDRGAADDDLRHTEDDADEQAKGPAFANTLTAVHDRQHEEGDDEAEHGANTGGDRGHHRDVQATGLG
ncbi:hypothetical protein QU40_00260, partial [Staphylococcus aureus]